MGRRGPKSKYDPAATTRVCCRCGVERPIEAFGVDRRRPHGRRAVCKECTRVRNPKRRGHKPKPRDAEGRIIRPPGWGEPPATKRCKECRKTKPAADFTRLRSARDGLATRCKACWKARWPYRPKPGQAKEQSGRQRRQLNDGYMRDLVATQLNIRVDDVTPEQIKAKRAAILERRARLKGAKDGSRTPG